MLLWHHAHTLADGARVEIEDRTNRFERVRPVWLVGKKPPLRLPEEPAVAKAGREAIPLDAIERVVKNGNHEPLLGRLLGQRSEMLRRQDDIELGQATGNSRQP
jgi:hypothetical protein